MNTHPQAIEPSSSLNDPSAARRSRIAMGKAIVSEDTEAIKALLAWDANLASTPVDDHYDETPVMLAAREGKARSLDALLAAGGEALVDSSAPRYYDTTPLMAAASRQRRVCGAAFGGRWRSAGAHEQQHGLDPAHARRVQ
jgi:hypothetical protein